MTDKDLGITNAEFWAACDPSFANMHPRRQPGDQTIKMIADHYRTTEEDALLRVAQLIADGKLIKVSIWTQNGKGREVYRRV